MIDDRIILLSDLKSGFRENLKSKINLNILIETRVRTRNADMKQDLIEVTNYIHDNKFKKATRPLRLVSPNRMCRSY